MYRVLWKLFFLSYSFTHLTYLLFLKVSEMKKEGAASAGGGGRGEGTSGSGESTEIKTESKDEATSSSSLTEEQRGFTTASQIYSLKRKRIGAGLRGSSNPFQTASELLRASVRAPLQVQGPTGSGGPDCLAGSGESAGEGEEEGDKDWRYSTNHQLLHQS